jgi:2-polyprenyl-3-methyl-5-hydroxy-6-metoxy-1,4-benzoquinol methylase
MAGTIPERAIYDAGPVNTPLPIRVLVAIANFGAKNDAYLRRLIAEYRSMTFDVDIVVFSDLKKSLSDAELVVVDLKGQDPWALPFAHKKILAGGLNDYELFIYSEDDTLVTERNLRAFLEVSTALHEDEIAGFMRFEQGRDGELHFPDVHGYFHWDIRSVQSRGEYKFASFTNEHSACFVLTRQQLRRAIESGGFLVGPHPSIYDLACTASTDPYTQCGFTKLICISRFDDFLLHHVPNKYVEAGFGVSGLEMRRQLDTLLKISSNGHSPQSLCETQTKLKFATYSKLYYEPVRQELVASIPGEAKTLLSIGCGWGTTEAALAGKGLSVVAVPLDPVIPGGAEAAGVEMAHGDFRTAYDQMKGRSFDCILFSNIIHLVPDPGAILSLFQWLLSEKGAVILSVPKISAFLAYWWRLRRDELFLDFGGYESTGVHPTSRRTIRRWFGEAGMSLESIVEVPSPQARAADGLMCSVKNNVLFSEFVAVARRA